MESIADHALRKLFYLTVDIVVQDHLQSGIGRDFSLQQIARNHKRGTRDADLRTICCAAEIERGCDSNRTFGTDDADFDHAAVFKDLELGDDRRFWEENIIDLVILLIKVLILRKGDTFEKLSEPDQMLGAQILNEMIA
jgi:hypothetical protein